MHDKSAVDSREGESTGPSVIVHADVIQSELPATASLVVVPCNIRLFVTDRL